MFLRFLSFHGWWLYVPAVNLPGCINRKNVLKTIRNQKLFGIWKNYCYYIYVYSVWSYFLDLFYEWILLWSHLQHVFLIRKLIVILLWNLTVILNCRFRWEKLIFQQLQYHDFLQNSIKGSTYSKRRTHELVWYGLWHMACIRLMAMNQGFKGARRTSSSTLHSWTQT